jgi:hypothetical protein
MRIVVQHLLVLFAAWALPAALVAQPGPTLKIGQNTCSYFGERLPDSLTTFASDREAEDVISRIVKAVGLVPNFDIKAAGVPNAAAAIDGGRRLILYSQFFVRELRQRTGTDWAAISVMAHEIGHHLNGHTLLPGGSRPKLELEADYFSGSVLQKMGATLDDARKAMELLGSAQGSLTHPAKHDRLAAITNGWISSCNSDARCKDSGARTSPEPDRRPTPAPTTDSKPPRQGPDSCEYAKDGTCDEPDLCDRGTDTTDCRRRPTPDPVPRVQLYCCDQFGRKWCPMVIPAPLGNICSCAGVPGSGWVCQ